MKHLYRCLLIVICMVLWMGVWLATENIEISAEKARYDHSFSFPGLLQNTDLYLWALCTDEDGTKLLMQNIGQFPISDVEIVFLSSGEKFIFEAEELLPGDKMWITERTGGFLSEEGKIICASFFVK